MTNPSPARPPLVLDEAVAASEEAGDYNAQNQAASALVNCRVALSAEMAIRIGKATRTTLGVGCPCRPSWTCGGQQGSRLSRKF